VSVVPAVRKIMGTRCAARAAHQLGQLEAVHLRHVHVDQGQRHVIFEQQLQRLATGPRAEDHQALTLEERIEGHEVFLDVVDSQEIDRRALRHHGIVVVSQR
jgi:hypothetical protein